MVNFFVNRIQSGIMTIEQVPPLWRERVQKALEESGAEPEISALE